MSDRDTSTLRVPYGFSVHGDEEIDAVVKVLRGNTALGDQTKAFEQKVTAMFGKQHGVMVNSGSSANLLALELLDLPPGSEVITPLLTFATTVAPIIQKGLVPVFVDVDPATYVVNPEKVKQAISKRTRALMIPSLMGNVPDLAALSAIAKEHDLRFIEDSCDTLGGIFDGRPTGEYSDITTTSFYGSHVINGAGGGGMICVNDPEWLNRLIVLRGWGRQSSLFGEKENSERLEHRFGTTLDDIPYDNKFIFSEVGYNFLPLEISAAFALVQLKKFPAFAKARRARFAELHEFFRPYGKTFTLAELTPKVETVWLAFPLIINDGVSFSRLELVRYLENRNIQTRPIFTGNILKQPGFTEIPHRLAQNDYPNTERVMRNALVVASHHGLSDAQMAYLKETFTAFLAEQE